MLVNFDDIIEASICAPSTSSSSIPSSLLFYLYNVVA